MHHVLIALAVLAIAPQSAGAYTCTLSPSKDAVIVKTGNPDAQPKSCTVTCNFAVPGGVEPITCTQMIPGGAKDWYVCIRPTGGKAFGRVRERQRKMRAALTRVTVLARASRYTPQ